LSYLREHELDQRLPVWMEAVREFSDRFRELRAEQSALVVVDMQTEFFPPDGLVPLWGGPAIVPRLKRLIATFRSCGRPVIYTKHFYVDAEVDGGATGEWWRLTRDSSFLKAGQPNVEIHPELAPVEGEYVVEKHRYSGFFSTNLDSLLRAFVIKDVVIAGVASNCCCEATAHDALFRDFHVFFLADGTGGSDEASHVAVLRDIAWTYGTIVTCDQVSSQLQGGH
jgi:nicotinamidase-related amidase